jgi:Response regulator receiver domain
MPTAKILLVDDVDFFPEIEKDYLPQIPAEILIAGNGQIALEQAEQHRPNVIFMDVNMPVMDGLTCCRKLKADPRLKDIPVIMILPRAGTWTGRPARPPAAMPCSKNRSIAASSCKPVTSFSLTSIAAGSEPPAR